jgi:hypothetical protein
MHEPETTAGSRTRAIAFQLALELVTVFIGVTLAFAFDNYRDNAQRRHNQRILESSIVDEIKAFDLRSHHWSDVLHQGLTDFERQRAQGKRPVPFYFRIPGVERPPTDVWQAALQSGAGELLDPDVMVILGRYYNEVSGEGVKYIRYATSIEQSFFPVLESDTTDFYDRKTGDLKPIFKAQLRQLSEIADDIHSDADSAHSLLAQLAGRLK